MRASGTPDLIFGVWDFKIWGPNLNARLDAKGPETDLTIETDCHQVPFCILTSPIILSSWKGIRYVHENWVYISYCSVTSTNAKCFVLKALKMFSSKYTKDEIVRTSNFILGTFSPTTKQQSWRLSAHKKRDIFGYSRSFQWFSIFCDCNVFPFYKKIVCLGVCSDFTEVALASEDTPAQKVPWQ